MPKLKKGRSSFYGFSRAVCFFFFRVFFRLEVKGQNQLPKSGPIILAANHKSYADPPLVGVACNREIHFLAKKELFSFPPFRWLISNLNAHRLNRVAGTAGLKEMQNLLSQGYPIIVFPEGKRIKSDQLGKPKSGVGLLAKKSNVPVIPVYIHNSAGQRMRKLKKIVVEFGQPVTPSQFKSYDKLTEEVMHQIGLLKSKNESVI